MCVWGEGDEIIFQSSKPWRKARVVCRSLCLTLEKFSFYYRRGGESIYKVPIRRKDLFSGGACSWLGGVVSGFVGG